ncbi:MAG: WD40 repeat domain-containing protein [Promethearchaeota archaeon]
MQVLKGHHDPVSAVAVTPDGRHVISGSSDKTVRIWVLESGRQVRVLKAFSYPILSLTISLDIKFIILAHGIDIEILRFFTKEKRNKVLKILEFIFKKERFPIRSEMIRDLSFAVGEVNEYINLLKDPFNDIPLLNNLALELKAEKVIKRVKEPNLYDLMKKLDFYYEEALLIGKYLLESNLIKTFPLVPSYSEKEVRVKKKNLIKEPDLTSFQSEVMQQADLEIAWGGAWKIEGNQSVFYFKVKVKNVSSFIISNIKIILSYIPNGLDSEKLESTINILKPNALESPTFKLIAKEDCVGDFIQGIIVYLDHLGTQKTIEIKPFKIKYVCNLLRPKPISLEEYYEKVEFMEQDKILINSYLNIDKLESFIERVIRECNFALIEQIKDLQRENIRTIQGFAQGIYDKQDVGLSIVLKKVEKGTNLAIKAMSERGEKILDILRDFSTKLDDIKSDTELIKEYTSQIESLFDNLGKLDDIEQFLREHLASNWEKIKGAWEDYREKKINRKEFIKKCIKILGKLFIKKILGRFF